MIIGDATTLTRTLFTLPTAAAKCGLSVDRVRTASRLREAELIARGVLVKVGRWRLVAADRLTDLAAVVSEPLRGV